MCWLMAIVMLVIFSAVKREAQRKRVYYAVPRICLLLAMVTATATTQRSRETKYSSVTAQRNSNVTLMCVANPPDGCFHREAYHLPITFSHFEWRFNQEPIVENDTCLVVGQFGMSLTITNISKKYASSSNYTCIVKTYEPAQNYSLQNCSCALSSDQMVNIGCYNLNSTETGQFTLKMNKTAVSKTDADIDWDQTPVYIKAQSDIRHSNIFFTSIASLGHRYERQVEDGSGEYNDISQVFIIRDVNPRDAMHFTCPVIYPGKIVWRFYELNEYGVEIINNMEVYPFLRLVTRQRWSINVVNMSTDVVKVSCFLVHQKNKPTGSFSWLLETQRNNSVEFIFASLNRVLKMNTGENASIVLLDNINVGVNQMFEYCTNITVKGNTFDDRLLVELYWLRLEEDHNNTVESAIEHIERGMLSLKDRWNPYEFHYKQRSTIRPCILQKMKRHDIEQWFVWKVRRLIDDVSVMALQKIPSNFEMADLAEASSASPLVQRPSEMNVLYTMIGIMMAGMTCSAVIIVTILLRRAYRRKLRRHQETEADADPMEMARLNADLVTVANPIYHAWSQRGWDIPRHRLVLGDVVGQGEFGIVYKATIRTGQSDTVVAVKTHRDAADLGARAILASELEILKKVGGDGHPNILQLIGNCVEGSQLYIVMEYAEHGSLKSILDSVCRDVGYSILRDSSIQHTVRDLLNFAHDVASGMAFLESKNIVHSDLAARNVLITNEGVLKIADFGMTGETEYYHRCSQGLMPVKWMAPESLSERKFTTKSDRWAFGVLLWEIFSLGACPYPAVQLPQMFEIMLMSLRQGKRMARPRNAPVDIYQLMLMCWHYQPNQRPPFVRISTLIDVVVDNTMPEMKLVAPLSPMYEGRLVSPRSRSRTTEGDTIRLGVIGGRHGSLDHLNRLCTNEGQRLIRFHSLGSLSSAGLLTLPSLDARGSSRSPEVELKYVTELQDVDDERSPMLSP